MGDVVLKRVSNLLTILELKEDYIECNKNKDAKGLTTDRVRFFVMGKELKNDLFVYSYDITADLTIQAMIKAK